jgi:hypothetical protein
MIKIEGAGSGLIGDSLAAVPYILERCKQHDTQAYVGADFNREVISLLHGQHHPLFFEDAPEGLVTYKLDLSGMWHHCEKHGWPWHMAQGYFAYEGLSVPTLPMSFRMKAQGLYLRPSLIISPFSRSNNPVDNNKLWPHERWVMMARQLQAKGVVDTVYVVGGSVDDNVSYYSNAGFEVLFAQPLWLVLGFLQSAKLVMTVDNGIGHLCHFGNVKNHVLQYPDCLPPKFAESPYAEHVRGRMPIDISVEQMVDGAMRVLAK